MESNFFKCFIFILSRLEFFALKYTFSSAEAPTFLAFLLFPFCFNILSIFVWMSKMSFFLLKEPKLPFIIAVCFFCLVYSIMMYYFDNKKMYRKMVHKLKNDKYFKILESRRNFIDFLLIVHSVLWIFIFAVIICFYK